MTTLKLSHIYKEFKLSDSSSAKVLRDISLSFPDTGLIGIIGKSGCGKSTLLSLIALLDRPTSGEVIVDGKSSKNLRRKQIEALRRNEIGIVFQGYNLLDDQDVIYNISLPLLIKGYSRKAAYRKAVKLLESINYPKELYKQKVNKLSGGEKQRVAILRAISTSPRILLCDEPTGALDSDNSLLIMSLLKKISKDVLVIVVSHNQSLITNMSDQIIQMKDGAILKQIEINKVNSVSKPRENKKKRLYSDWTDKIVFSNFKRRLGRNIVSIISLSICLIATTLVVGFMQNIDTRIDSACRKHLDIGVSTISKETSSNLDNTVITLVRSSRPTREEITALEKEYSHYYYELNYDAILPSATTVKYGENILEDYLYTSIYSFVDKSINKDLLIKGKFPSEDSLLEVVVNKKAYDNLKKYIDEPLNEWIDMSYRFETSYYTYDEENTIIADTFAYQKRAKVVGVVDELSFLTVPTIYYSYVALDEYMSSYPLNNYSTYIGYTYTWKEKILDEINTNKLTSYSYKIFLKNHADYQLLKHDQDNIEKGYSINNNSLTIASALKDIISASCVGVELFLMIALIGTILIVGLVSFSAYSEDKRRSAILSCLGADLFDIIDIYIYENILIIIFSLLIMFLSIIPLKNITNYVLFNFVGISDLITLPSYLIPNIIIPYSYYLGLIIISLVVISLSTFIPIIINKKISIKEELKEE